MCGSCSSTRAARVRPRRFQLVVMMNFTINPPTSCLWQAPASAQEIGGFSFWPQRTQQRTDLLCSSTTSNHGAQPPPPEALCVLLSLSCQGPLEQHKAHTPALPAAANNATTHRLPPSNGAGSLLQLRARASTFACAEPPTAAAATKLNTHASISAGFWCVGGWFCWSHLQSLRSAANAAAASWWSRW